MHKVQYIVCYSDGTWSIYSNEYPIEWDIDKCMSDIKAICEEKLDNLVGVYHFKQV